MKALVFAAGLGTRLKPFTLSHPKALAPVGGEPMLGRVIRNLVSAGVDGVVVNVHHFPEQIREFLAHRDFGVPVTISDESDLLLDTGGGVAHAEALLKGDEPFIVHNADILTNLDLKAMYSAHLVAGADVTLLATPRMTDRHLYFDSENRLKGWANIRTGESRPSGFTPDKSMRELAFGGVHIISPTIFPRLKEYAAVNGPVFPIVPFYLQELNNIRINAYTPTSGFVWIDVGKPETLEKANEYVRNNG